MVTGTQIPNGWRVARLRELLVLDQPGVWGEEPTGDDSAVPVLRAANLTKDGRIDLSRVMLRRISDWDIKRRLMRDGDLILERSGGGPGSPVGRVALIQDHEKIYCSNFCQQLRFDAHQAYPPYMFRYLWRQYLLGVTARLEQRTTGIRNLDYSGYLLQSVILPPLPEQRAIADILDSIDEAIARTEVVITATEHLRESLLHELLTRGIPGWHSEWNEVRGIGTIPSNWDVVRLGDVAAVQTGRAVNRKATGGGGLEIHYLSVANVKDGYLDLSIVKTMVVSEREIVRYQLRDGDVLFTEGGDADKLGRGTVWHGEIPLCLHQNHVFAVRPHEKAAQSEFLTAYASSAPGKRYFLGAAKQTTNLASINSTQLKQMLLPLPSIREQAMIVEVLAVSDETIEQARTEKYTLNSLKASVADALLTARVRVAI